MKTALAQDGPAIRPGIEVLSAADRAAAYQALSARTGATYFRLRQRLVTEGRAATCLAATDTFRIAIKVYASGGERALHAHPHEVHTFIVLHGRVRFFDDTGASIALQAHEGALIPCGVGYRFVIESAEPAVMLRIGASNGDQGRADSPCTTAAAERLGETRQRPREQRKHAVFSDEYFE